MAHNEVPPGQLFSRIYLERGKPQADSKRFRSRLAAYADNLQFDRAGTARLVKTELGSEVRMSGYPHRIRFHYAQFFETAAMRDVLDTITLISHSLGVALAADFRAFVGRAMHEENLSYILDGAGGVHFFVDEEFERSRVSTLTCLSGDQNRAAREAFEDAHAALLADDTLSAVRRSFDAIENVFKMRFGVARLGASEVKGKLSPSLPEIYKGRSSDAAVRMAASLAEWVNAGHQYRHAPGEPDPSPPPIDLAVAMVAGAAGHLRWLAGLLPID